MTPSLQALPPSHSPDQRWDHLELLDHIRSSGSIAAAAEELGMTQTAAWLAVEFMNNLADQPVLEGLIEGSVGARLSDYGERVVGAWRRLEKEREKVLAALGQMMRDFEHYYQIVRRLDMKTSARNQFLGKVRSVNRGPISAEVVLDIGGGDTLTALITNGSAEELGLAPGSEAHALVKSPWVVLTTDEAIKTSARNQLAGAIVRFQEGAINAEVVIQLAGGKMIVATVTNDSARELELAVGKRVCALIKASHVILAVAA